ncbi:MAG: phospho-N-acetylmuramoyl-pentapeptide-transferase [Anaerolinea sp.]|nr:phospho-N-acetylmuramoyl-pentapeptide-transferase [Anaerolinea sp.]MCC6973691.1 phospho-N-acetylmuramoyl-pentapeptide-transferase [Anaerolineae bacterium]CAG0974085.1 phospho-N-acetylmuramoyl-pentapeptide-transferase [Anaerolineae bacterium]
MTINPLPFALTLGGITFLLTVIWGDPFIEVLKRLKIGAHIREDAPDWHADRAGTPTMGGILILVPVLLITLMLNIVNLLRPQEGGTGVSILLPLFALVAFGALGAVDDLLKLRTRGEGLSARTKIIGQIIFAGAVAITFSLANGGFQFANEVYVPVSGVSLPIPSWLFIPIAMFIIIGFSNAVNFTDGLDGLAGTVTVAAFVAYGLIALVQGQIYLMQFCFIMVGACFAFLWYNAIPAQLFMGDTGALALGACLGVVALMSGQWILLPLIAIVPVAEVLSVIAQVVYARWTGGQRLLRRAPLHYHYQVGGWSETQVVQRFFTISILAAMAGVALALL